MKKSIGGLMLAMFVFIIFLTCSQAATIVDSGTCGDNLTWVLDSDGTLNISGTGEMDNVYSYRDIPWYKDREMIKSIIMEDGLIKISSYAFEDCLNATKVIIPDSVTEIGARAFQFCSSLNDITLSNNIKSIGSNAFRDTAYYNDKNNWEDGALYLNKYLLGTDGEYLSGAYGIKDDTITISAGMFRNCSNLTSLYIPASVKYIGNMDLFNCNRLEFAVDENNECYSSVDGVLFNKDKTELISYGKDEIQAEYTIPDGVTKICEDAFSTRGNLKNIIIPDSVTDIGQGAFFRCLNLESVRLPNNLEIIDKEVFFRCPKLQIVFIPKTVTQIYTSSFGEASLSDVYYGGLEADWRKIDIINDLGYERETPFFIPIMPTMHYNAIGIKPPQITDTPTISNNKLNINLSDVEYDSSLITVFSNDNKIVYSSVTLLSAGDITKSVTLPNNGENQAKVFIWDSLEGMRPLCEAKNVTVK